VSGERPAPPLTRLVPRRELTELLAALAPLAPATHWRVLDAAGRRVAEQGEPGERAAAAQAQLRHGEVGVGVLELVLDPASDTTFDAAADVADRERATLALQALATLIERAVAAGAVRRDLAAETLERYREVHLAYRLAERLMVGVDLPALPHQVLAEALRVVPAATALLVIDDAIAAVIGADAADPSLAGLVADVRARANGRASIDTVVAGTDAAVPLPHGVGGAPEPTVSAAAGVKDAIRLWAPLQVGDAQLGGVLLTRPADAEVFSAGDAKLLTALATQAATIIENARLHANALAQARLARELQLAHDVQAQLMPKLLPSGDGWQLAAWWSAAREVAGDFYDATVVDGVTAVTVGDVADKGMAAALFMALTRSVLRASAGDGRGPGEVVARANTLLCADASDGMFVTLAHAQLGSDGTVRYANAGHNPPLVVRAGGSVETLPRTGILVGWDAQAAYGEATVRLDDGDTLVLYTDGITEARDADAREYGEARLVELVQRQVRAGADAATLLDSIRSDLATFVADAEPFDDATLVVASRRPPLHPHPGADRGVGVPR